MRQKPKIELTQGQKNKLRSLFELYSKDMQRAAMSILADCYDAEDAVQDAIETITKFLDEIDSVNAPKTRSLMIIITKSRARDILRSKNRSGAENIDDFEHALEDASASPDIWANSLAINDAVGRLREEYREILLLRYDNGFSTGETARLLGISYENAKKRITRAKAALEVLLKEVENDV